MDMHWTYTSCSLSGDLEQGDILKPSEELKAILKDVHPHFCDEKYTGFMVLTQSCDLVIREGKVKAPYLQICVIRGFNQVKKKLLEGLASADFKGVFADKDRSSIENSLRKLYNQNDQARGLFFLYRDFDNAGLAEDAVAFLRVSVSLRAEHYELIKASRTGKLKPDFRAKLGWLIGNLFDRPATPDWGDNCQKGTPNPVEALLKEHLASINWFPAKICKVAKKHGIDLLSASGPEEAKTRLPKEHIEIVIDATIKILRDLGTQLSEDLTNKLKGRLRNDSNIKGCLKAE